MSGDKTNFFQPSFGNRPSRIVGRDSELSSVIAGLREPPGARERCILILGQRGMGKTAMLLEIAERAVSEGFIVARVTAHEEMPSAIIDQFQLNG
ncbi:MAG: ATP-binding protein, partial [Lachnospiraceae bacterium]|nr:ATP-binding protein [Lachnospiraceae bacterium]